MYEVEKIVAHKAGRTKSKWAFTVRWAGYGADADDILPYKDVKDLYCFRQYIREQNLDANVFPREDYPLME